MHDIGLIVGMFLVTYSIRYLPFAMADRVKFPDWLNEALSYVPVAALTAIIAPLIVYQDHRLNLDWHNAHLVASAVAFMVAFKTRNLLLTVIIGLSVFFVMRLVIFPV